MFSSSIKLLSVALAVGPQVTSCSRRRLLSAQKDDAGRNTICNVQLVSVLFADHSSTEWFCEQDPLDEEGQAIARPIVGMPEEFWADHVTQVVQGNWWIETKSSGWTPGIHGGSFNVSPGAPVAFHERNSNNQRTRALAKKNGVSSVLVLRVSGLDAIVAPSAAQLARAIFGANGGDPINPAAQYDGCSHGAFQLIAATGETVIDGVMEVFVSMNIANSNSDDVANAAERAAEKALGVSIRATFNHGEALGAVVVLPDLQFPNKSGAALCVVLFVLPQGTYFSGTRDWVAFADVSGYRCYFNDQSATSSSSRSLSIGVNMKHRVPIKLHASFRFDTESCVDLCPLIAVIHEIGHNLGLLHAGQAANEYGDTTGQMGYSLSEDTFGRRCFNGDNSWQLGWYAANGYISPTLVVNETTTLNLVGSSSYTAFEPNAYVVVQVAEQFYIMFNEAAGFNADTGEATNKITVTQGGIGPPGVISGSTSTLLTSLAQNEAYTLTLYPSGYRTPVTVKVTEINTLEHFATISLSTSSEILPAPDCGYANNGDLGCCDQVTVSMDLGVLTMRRDSTSCCQLYCSWTAFLGDETFKLDYWPAVGAYLLTNGTYDSCAFTNGDIRYYPPQLSVEMVQASCRRWNSVKGRAFRSRGQPTPWYTVVLAAVCHFVLLSQGWGLETIQGRLTATPRRSPIVSYLHQ